MIFIIPIVLGAAALGTAAFGVIKGTEGVLQMKEAENIVQNAQKRHEEAVEKFKNEWETTQKIAEKYGQLQIKIKAKTVAQFVNLLEEINNSSFVNEKFLTELNSLSVQQIAEYKITALEAQKFARGGIGRIASGAVGGVGAIAAGAAGSCGATALAASIGVASTGTAISGLSGAAATNATLAWLGGGSLAAGGGGMALGNLLLNGVTVGPALVVAGIVLSGKGKNAEKKAWKYNVEVNAKIAELKNSQDFLKKIQQRIEELIDFVENLDSRAIAGLKKLESRSFKKKPDGEKIQKVALLIKILVKIMKTPILDSQGNLNSVAEEIIDMTNKKIFLRSKSSRRLEFNRAKVFTLGFASLIVASVAAIMPTTKFFNLANNISVPTATPANNADIPIADPIDNAITPAFNTMSLSSNTSIPTQPPQVSDPFRDAINKAMEAANNVQSAASRQDWQQVSRQWNEAIELLKEVDPSSPNYGVALKKIQEYQANLDYADKNSF